MDQNTRPHDPDTDNRPPTARDYLHDAQDLHATTQTGSSAQEAVNNAIQFSIATALVEISDALTVYIPRTSMPTVPS